MEEMSCEYFGGDTAVRACTLSRLAAILPTALVSAADTTLQQHLTIQDVQLIWPQMHTCLLLVANSLKRPMSAHRLSDSNKDEGTHQARAATDVLCRTFQTSLVVIKAAVVALGVCNQKDDDLCARAQLWMIVHDAARRMQACTAGSA